MGKFLFRVNSSWFNFSASYCSVPHWLFCWHLRHKSKGSQGLSSKIFIKGVPVRDIDLLVIAKNQTVYSTLLYSPWRKILYHLNVCRLRWFMIVFCFQTDKSNCLRTKDRTDSNNCFLFVLKWFLMREFKTFLRDKWERKQETRGDNIAAKGEKGGGIQDTGQKRWTCAYLQL